MQSSRKERSGATGLQTFVASATSTVSLVTRTKLSEIAPELWIIEQPLRYLGFETGRRMAVIRLADGGLLIHSPARLSPELGAALDQLGEVRSVVPASELHGHLYMEQYRDAYPQAKIFAAPGLEASARTCASTVCSQACRSRSGAASSIRWHSRGGAGCTRSSSFTPRRARSSRAICAATSARMADDPPHGAGSYSPAPWPSDGVPNARNFSRPHGCAALARRILEWDFERILPGHGEIVHSGGKALREGLRAAASMSEAP